MSLKKSALKRHTIMIHWHPLQGKEHPELWAHLLSPFWLILIPTANHMNGLLEQRAWTGWLWNFPIVKMCRCNKHRWLAKSLLKILHQHQWWFFFFNTCVCHNMDQSTLSLRSTWIPCSQTSMSSYNTLEYSEETFTIHHTIDTSKFAITAQTSPTFNSFLNIFEAQYRVVWSCPWLCLLHLRMRPRFGLFGILTRTTAPL